MGSKVLVSSARYLQATGNPASAHQGSPDTSVRFENNIFGYSLFWKGFHGYVLEKITPGGIPQHIGGE